MKVVRIRTRNLGFSRPPETLRIRLSTSATQFEDYRDKPGGWFGDVMLTLVEVEADDGTVGIGTAGAFHGGAKSIIDDYCADLVLGQDPRRHEHLWQRMYRTLIRFGRSGSAVAAISAIDIACWDLHARSEGRAVYDLIGGRTQTTVPCYVSRLYASEDPEEVAQEAKQWLAAGFTRMKQRFGWGPSDGPEGMARNCALVAAVRKVVGDDVELAADAYMGWDVGYAMEMAKRLEPYRLSWIEEPLMPHEVDGYVELKQRCGWQRWSCGEHSYTKWDFAELIARRAVDILQPDTNRAGGITEVLKICAMGEAAGLPVVPHSNEPHNTHITFSRPPHVCPVVEYFPITEPDTGNELFWKIFDGLPRASDGHLTLTDSPGLGVSVNADVASDLTVGAETVKSLGA